MGEAGRTGRTDSLREELESYLAIPGMQAAVLISDDGLVVSSASLPGVDTVGIAALAVDTVTSAQRFGLQVGAGYLDIMSVEFQKLTVVLVPFTRDVMLALIALPGSLSTLRARVGKRACAERESPQTESPQYPDEGAE